MQPTFFDYGVLFIVVTSALIGLFRGLIREVLALLGWLFAAWVAYTFSGVAAGWMPESLPGGPVARHWQALGSSPRIAAWAWCSGWHAVA